jgi:hypothetical protein
MRFTVQAESLDLLREALASRCDGIRFGSEFCEWKLPKLEVLKEAFEWVRKAEKAFTYVTPLLSDIGVKELQKHLTYLNDLGGVEVVVGDLGTLNLLRNFSNLRPRLGRLRVYIPARCPWPQITRMPNPSFLTRRKVEKIFYQTSLNHRRSLEYYKALGVEGADMDWIPKCFPHFEHIVERGFRLAVHTYAIPVAVSGRCHTARFLGEKGPAQCTLPCLDRAFIIRQRELERGFVLHGNVVFSMVQPQQREVKELHGMGVDELVLPMGPVSKLTSAKDVDASLTALASGV